MSKPVLSAREIADGIMDAIPKHPAFPLVDWRCSDSGRRHRDAIASALTAERADENEACAKVAEAHYKSARLVGEHNTGYQTACKRLAASIRSRQTPTPTGTGESRE